MNVAHPRQGQFRSGGGTICRDMDEVNGATIHVACSGETLYAKMGSESDKLCLAKAIAICDKALCHGGRRTSHRNPKSQINYQK